MNARLSYCIDLGVPSPSGTGLCLPLDSELPEAEALLSS